VKLQGPQHPDFSGTLLNLGVLYRNQGRYVEAADLSRHALKIREKALGGSDPQVAHALNMLGAVYLDQGKYTKAEPHFVRALRILEQRTRPIDRFDMVTSLLGLADVYSKTNRKSEAEKLKVRARVLRLEQTKETH